MERLTRESLRIVHVEDNDEFALLSAIYLKRAGFQQPILRCDDGRAALRYFSGIGPELAPHVILLDLHMPHMNGLEILCWLRHNFVVRDIAIYLLTSSTDQADMRQAANAGVTKYLVKSPSLDELIQNLDHLIDGINSQRREPKAAVIPEVPRQPDLVTALAST